MTTLFACSRYLRKLFADAGYQGPEIPRDALAKAIPGIRWNCYMLPPCQWVQVLPSAGWWSGAIGWLNRCRRLAKDFEDLSRNALASYAWRLFG